MLTIIFKYRLRYLNILILFWHLPNEKLLVFNWLGFVRQVYSSLMSHWKKKVKRLLHIFKVFNIILIENHDFWFKPVSFRLGKKNCFIYYCYCCYCYCYCYCYYVNSQIDMITHFWDQIVQPCKKAQQNWSFFFIAFYIAIKFLLKERN